ncbi:hypothetical protein P775_15120 [Puniceibacterium antarcticum]|uniref:Uncharacterized protein n=1 Tax=Puniceibacterium antarcticum TaxID=1206336 RepID=A0A2G8REE4_9RHOB|nr:hypothetical protein [Puniceibacterium antarcticum]PIL19468.1 hypothetical protein P775_15120 [Puniceibacterium antarcticum]
MPRHGVNIGLGTDIFPVELILNKQRGMRSAHLVDGMEAVRSESVFAARLGGRGF